MAYNVISYEDRLDRLSRRLPSDPVYAASAILELAGTPLIELFDEDRKKIGTVVKPVLSEGIRPYSTLAETAAVLEPLWKERCEDWEELRKAGYALAKQLAELAGITVFDDATDAPKGKDAASKRDRPSSACMAKTQHAVGGQAAATVMSLADRMDEYVCDQSLAPRRVGSLHYTAFVEGVATATSTKENTACIEELESSWNVAPDVSYASVLAYAVENPDVDKAPWLIESFVLTPFMLISLYH